MCVGVCRGVWMCFRVGMGVCVCVCVFVCVCGGMCVFVRSGLVGGHQARLRFNRTDRGFEGSDERLR